MHREDFSDAPPDAIDADIPDQTPDRVRRPLHGGWVLMIAAGLVAAVANYALLTAEDPGVEVMVVSQAAAAGTPLDQVALESRALGITDPGAHLLTTSAQLESLAGTVTAVRLEPGALLRSSDLRIPAGQGQGAMSVPVDPSRAAGGLIAAGDAVDVIAERDDRVEYVVTGVDVLDVMQSGGAVGQVGGGYAVTLSVDADDALALATALRTGEVDVVRTAEAPR